MTDPIRIRPLFGANGQQLLGHWSTACGYRISPTRLGGFALTRASEDAPFAYLSAQDVLPIIRADKAAQREASA